MPYKSEAQRKKFKELAEQGKISPEKVAEFDQASRGLKLPERVSKTPSGQIGASGPKTLKDLQALSKRKGIK